MGIFLRWSCLLALSLIGPISLPAGGASRLQPLVRRQGETGLLIASPGSILRCSPAIAAPVLNTIEDGAPLRILRYWQSNDGCCWVHVKDGYGMRGWLNV